MKGLLETISFIFLLLLLATILVLPTTILADNDQPASVEKGACDFDTMEAFFLEQLGISNVTITYSYEQLSHPYHLGQARQTGHHEYHIKLANHLEPSELRITLAHELVHVRQFERGEIKKDEFQKDYMMRSHEDEAFRLSLPMARNFFLNHNCSL